MIWKTLPEEKVNNIAMDVCNILTESAKVTFGTYTNRAKVIRKIMLL